MKRFLFISLALAAALVAGYFLYVNVVKTMTAPGTQAEPLEAGEIIDKIHTAGTEIVEDAFDAIKEKDDSEEVETKAPPAEDIGFKERTYQGDIRTAVLAGGCFWCVEADLEKVPGVSSVVSGYSGGTAEDPTYDTYSSGGHREVVEVTYDAGLVSYRELVDYFLKHIDPTDPDGSFYDRGVEYSPAIYFGTDEEKRIAGETIASIDDTKVFDVPLAVPLITRSEFYAAEDYHQDYYKKNALKYGFYRTASGRDAFIKKHWGEEADALLHKKTTMNTEGTNSDWQNFTKPSDEELRGMLTDIQYKVTQKEGTEPAFQNEYWDDKAQGIYVDVISGEPLFSSRDKFDSGTGWPSFTKPIEQSVVVEKKDFKLIIPRTEVRSAIADSHLGHVFNDAPEELGGVRYCMNSAALRFIPKDKMEEEGYGAYLPKVE